MTSSDIVFSGLTIIFPVVAIGVYRMLFSKSRRFEGVPESKFWTRQNSWILCGPGLVLIVAIAPLLNRHLVEKYPFEIYSVPISISILTFVYFSGGSKINKNNLIGKFMALPPVIFSILALMLSSEDRLKGALLITVVFFQSPSIGLVFLRWLGRF